MMAVVVKDLEMDAILNMDALVKGNCFSNNASNSSLFFSHCLLVIPTDL
jgi:hypothetical protein